MWPELYIFATYLYTAAIRDQLHVKLVRREQTILSGRSWTFTIPGSPPHVHLRH
jgi:hypothetical protein